MLTFCIFPKIGGDFKPDRILGSPAFSTYYTLSFRISRAWGGGKDFWCFSAHCVPCPGGSPLAKSFTLVFWCELLSVRVPELRRELHFLEGSSQNSLKGKLSLLPTNLPLFVVNQLAKSSEVKKCTFCCLWLTEAECLPQWQSLGNDCILGMSDFSHLIYFSPRLPSWPTGPQNWDITFPTFLAIPSTCAPLFIMVLSAPGVHCQLGSDFSGPPGSQELNF